MRFVRLLSPVAALIAAATAAAATAAAAQGSTPATTPNTLPATQQPAAHASPLPPLPADSFALARKYTKWFYDRQIDSLLAHHVEQARQQPDIRTRLAASIDELASRAGKEVWVTDERFITRNGQRQYWRTATFSDFREPLLFRWVMNSRGEITGIGMGPLSQAPTIDPAP
jgi:hypothetical protein